MILLDANVLIALFKIDYSQHDKSVKLFYELIKTQTLVGIPEYVLVEVCTVLIQRADKPLANVCVERIQQNALIQIMPSSEQFFTAVLGYFMQETHTGLSFTDVSLLYLSRTHTILTFDEQLKRAIKKSV